LTVTLPLGIRAGEQYTITVRQFTEASAVMSPPPTIQVPAAVSRRATRPNRRDVAVAAAPAAVVEVRHTWRRVTGAFQFGFQIKPKEVILLNEERLLATLRWITLNMPTEKRWYPVLLRYIAYVTERVRLLGGNPTQILPSPTGWVPGLPEPEPERYRRLEEEEEGFTGKIAGLTYDHFGYFEGLVLETESGHYHRFFSREHAVRELAQRAKEERSRVRIEGEDRHIRRIVVL
jgi:hypothetical protein